MDERDVGERYYREDFGRPYRRDNFCLAFYAGIADIVVSRMAARRVLDAGCAMGFLRSASRAWHAAQLVLESAQRVIAREGDLSGQVRRDPASPLNLTTASRSRQNQLRSMLRMVASACASRRDSSLIRAGFHGGAVPWRSAAISVAS